MTLSPAERARRFFDWIEEDSARDSGSPEVQDRLAAEFREVESGERERCARYFDRRAKAARKKAHYYEYRNTDSLGRFHPARASAESCAKDAREFEDHAAALRREGGR